MIRERERVKLLIQGRRKGFITGEALAMKSFAEFLSHAQNRTVP